jgi:hypothetical protein
VLSNLTAIGQRMEVWRGRAAAEGASLLVWGSELAERGEKYMNASIEELKATMTVVA